MRSGTRRSILMGLLVWALVASGTYAIARHRKRAISIADALMIGLGASVVFWMIEWVARRCEARSTEAKAPEAFSDVAPMPQPVVIAPSPSSIATASIAAEEAYATYQREADVLYSGDLIDLFDADPLAPGKQRLFQRDPFQSELLMGPPGQGNLSKIRFVAEKHDARTLQPLRYRQPIFWMHSAYANQRNQHDLVIKRSTTLLSHQTGPTYRTFMLVHPQNPADQGVVRVKDPVCIVALAEGDMKEAFLRVREDRRIDDRTDNQLDRAAKFQIVVRRTAEPGDHHLNVAPLETLFP